MSLAAEVALKAGAIKVAGGTSSGTGRIGTGRDRTDMETQDEASGGTGRGGKGQNEQLGEAPRQVLFCCCLCPSFFQHFCLLFR